MAGYYDPQGIYRYAEDDVAAPFSDLLNLGMESVSARVAELDEKIDEPSPVQSLTLQANWVAFPGYGTPGLVVRGGLCYLTSGLLAQTGGGIVTPGNPLHFATLPATAPDVPEGGVYGVGIAFPNTTTPAFVYVAILPTRLMYFSTDTTITFGSTPQATNSLRVPTIVWPVQ